MKFCKKCVMPDTKPDLHFDEYGVCDACNSQIDKNENINWQERQREFLELIKKYKKHPIYDCVIGVSGGKDSTFQVLKCLELGLNPLCVCFEPSIPTKIGKKNLANLNNLGVDLIHIKRNPKIYKKLAKEAFIRTGDNEWQNHLGIFTSVPRIAINFNIPLIIWGESPQVEYGGPASSKDKNTLGREWLEEFGGLLGNRISDMIGVDGISEKDLYFYTYPSDEELQRVGVSGLFLGYYFKWDYKNNLKISKENGFITTDKPVETTYENFENLDCYSNHLHDYLKYCKYGFGRATDNACLDIRLGYIDREEGVRLVQKYDGKPPKKAIKKYLQFSGFSEDEFEKIVDSFTNRKIFKRDKNGKFLKDSDGSLIKNEEYILK
ncbi:N-acetyl sugar amidotransferase [Campylobacter insulaenigrae]|uniref:pseudaminic acid biosynthesis protein PseA n=1 Tax=Campylobacter insulaenigrae TaxID=260714 RepID=UPI002152D9F0|nr:N-acetyl sugar amidotransferase [Campylobacter insulaenigrae]MCR6570873.1 N-acetyl sugar amidotransferase [Campylobacter insulaenigrae]MCR6574085.1 N-acetyl sugar amidotransferase [Campylobacter insulaenigrae]MCR6575159.1 N-acetyl sugar amidotransferase [Campylobacter insulaenigrae]MCR6577684.1 N-acetyl sugar amidotransferase [Campylobacter insulaenigrae]MCR6579279.1 N-acetyl sugar amidotransferase [Campylobacter insulaenigrae]